MRVQGASWVVFVGSGTLVQGLCRAVEVGPDSPRGMGGRVPSAVPRSTHVTPIGGMHEALLSDEGCTDRGVGGRGSCSVLPASAGAVDRYDPGQGDGCCDDPPVGWRPGPYPGLWSWYGDQRVGRLPDPERPGGHGDGACR